MKKLIGSRAFYRMTLSLLIPVILQNGLTNFVNLLDNVMIGLVGIEEMSGIAISNQLTFIYTLFIFGAASGAGIFTAQFHGSGDIKGIRYTMRFKLMSCVLIALLCMGLFYFFGPQLVGAYLVEDDTTGDPAAVLRYGTQYLRLMLIGFIPLALSTSYAFTLRETGDTTLPLISTIAAIATNCSLNYILIFGKFGAPALGVKGAAIATVISRFVELAVIVIVTHCRANKYTFIRGTYRSMRVPMSLTRDIIKKGLPLTINELLWSTSMAVLNQCYAMRGIAAISGVNISSTVTNLFSVIFFSMGTAVAIIVGRELGAGLIEQARDSAAKLIAFSCFLSVCVAGVVVVAAPFIARIYKASHEVHSIATGLMIVSAFLMPACAVTNASYFTIRSGGNTVITFIFDSVFMWMVFVPLAYVLSRMTSLPIIPLYLCCQSPEIIKALIGVYLVKRGRWAKNITEANATDDTLSEQCAAA